jgi:hypothetical protein
LVERGALPGKARFMATPPPPFDWMEVLNPGGVVRPAALWR